MKGCMNLEENICHSLHRTLEVYQAADGTRNHQSFCRSRRLEGTRSDQLPHASINKVETATGSSDKVWNPPTQFSSPRGYCYYRGILSLLSYPKTNQDLQRDTATLVFPTSSSPSCAKYFKPHLHTRVQIDMEEAILYTSGTKQIHNVHMRDIPTSKRMSSSSWST